MKLSYLNNLLKIAVLGLACVFPLSYAAEGIDTKIKEAIVKAGKAVNMPSSKSIVVFSEPESIVITDNPRYVVKGRVFDMWQNVEITNNAELDASTKVIPLNKIEIVNRKVLEARVNQEKQQIVTVFLDPFLPDSAETIRVLTKYATDYQLRFVFTAMSQDSVDPLLNMACETKGLAPETVIQQIISGDVKAFQTERKCNETLAMNSFGLTHFLRINKSPTLIAPNGVVSEKLPPNLMQWLSVNEG